jgi:hypothetical protein
MDLTGKMLDAWVLFDGPAPNGTCLFDIAHTNRGSDELRIISFVGGQTDVWINMHAPIPTASDDVREIDINCSLEDSWPGTLYIDDVSIR